MIYLLLSLVLACIVYVLFKHAAIKNYDSDQITIINYIFASGLSFLYVLSSHQQSVFKYLPQADIDSLMSVKSPGNTALIILLVGTLLGVFFAVNLIQTKQSVALNGASLTSFFKQTGFIGGLFIAILFYGERPSGFQWLGIMMILASLVLMISDFNDLKIRAPFLLLLLLVSGAFVEAANKFFAQFTIEGYQMLFLSFAFCCALVYSAITLVLLKRTRKRFGKHEILCGAMLGVSNLLSNFCKLKSLTILPAAIVIPTISAGTLVLATVLGIVVYREQTNKRSICAMLIATISIVILNV